MSKKPSEVVREATSSSAHFDKTITDLPNSIKSGAPFSVSKEVITTIKKAIKDKNTTAVQKLRALQLLHSCVMAANTDFLMFTQKKILSRLTHFASHNKHSKELDRGKDIFGKISAAGPYEQKASEDFLKCLLNYIRTWAEHFGTAPGGGQSGFYKAYMKLINDAVAFPPKPESPKKSPAKKPPPKKTIDTTLETIQNIQNTLEFHRELVQSENPPLDALEEVRNTLATMKTQLEVQIENAMTSSNSDQIEMLLDLNDQVQAALNQSGKAHSSDFEVDEEVPEILMPTTTKPQSDPINLLDLDIEFSSPPPKQTTQELPSASPYSSSYSSGPSLLTQLQSENSQLKSQIKDRQLEDSGTANQVHVMESENQGLKNSLEGLQQTLNQKTNTYNQLFKKNQELKQEYQLITQKIQTVSEQLKSKSTIQSPSRSLGPSKELEKPSQSPPKQATSQAFDPFTELHSPPKQPPSQPFDPFTELEKPPQSPPKQSSPQTLQLDNRKSYPSEFESSNPFDADSSSEEDQPFEFKLPEEPKVTELGTVNKDAYRIVNSTGTGVLYDDEDIQVGFKCALQNNEVQAIMFIGNKSNQPIQELITEIKDCDENLKVAIDQTHSSEGIPQNSKANRRLRGIITGFSSAIPALSLKICYKNSKLMKLLLPLTMIRFIEGFKGTPTEALEEWDAIEGSETISALQMNNITSMKELANHINLAGAFSVFSCQELKNLTQAELLGLGTFKDYKAGLLVKVIDPRNMKVALSVRSQSPKLRDTLLPLLKLQISGNLEFN